VCQVLGIVNVADAVSRLDDDQKITIVNADGNPRAGINHTLLAVNESGLYDLTLDSRKPEARRIRKWVVSDVMPTLRKTGRYQIGPSEAQAMPRQFNMKIPTLLERHD
jgi:prophage antirepressor-like protein